MKSHTSSPVVLLMLILACVASPLHAQTTIYVDDAAPNDPGPGDPLVSDPLEDGSLDHPFDAIQEGIGAAVNGDEVVIGPGLYTGEGNRDIDLLGKAITVRSLNGPDTCVIDCEGSEEISRLGFLIETGEGPGTILEGLTLQNGWSDVGSHSGGMNIHGASPRVVNCVIRHNMSQYGVGGGIRSTNGNPTFIDCRFIDNEAYRLGGGLYILGGTDVRIERCLFQGNRAGVLGVARDGGGLTVSGTRNVLVRDTVFIDNTAVLGRGGGLSVQNDASVLVANCQFAGNSSALDGGGADISSAAVMFSACSFTGNTSGGRGGGIYYFGCIDDSSGRVVDTHLHGNDSVDDGGGIHANQSDLLLMSSTLSQNSTEGQGGGVASWWGSHVTVRDSILYGNTALEGGSAGLVGFGSDQHASILDVNHSNIEGGQGAILLMAGSTVLWGDGMIDADPLFVSGPNGDHYLSQVAAGQAVDSPCLDTGSAPADSICWDTPEGPSCISQRSSRTDEINDQGTVDMGAHFPVFSRVSPSLTCQPSTGTVPFGTLISVGMQNELAGEFRQASGKLNAALANGLYYPSWRAGHLVLAPGEDFLFSWNQQIPATGTVIGENTFTLVVADVTPAPYNQPPYSPSGSTDRAWCTVTGLAP